jgi:xanthine dehydrogenase small subunit
MKQGRLRLWINDEVVEVDDVSPTTTLLEFLRGPRRLTGTKEGCAEGDCGACTVVLIDPGPEAPRARAINSCLVLLPMVQGKRVYTVESLGSEAPHPVQAALVERLGSQCGYCTPGVIMAMAEAAHRDDLDAPWKLDDQMCGNLCRCTGYRPIREATQAIAGSRPSDCIARGLADPRSDPPAQRYEHGDQRFFMPTSFDALWDALEDPQARVVCGGTDLSLEVTKAHKRLPSLVSVEALPGLRRIEPVRVAGDAAAVWSVGAAVTLSDLEAAMEAAIPPVARILRFFGSRQIKHRATVGGNLCNASPIGDLAPVFLALGATVVLRSRDGRREVPIDEFFLGYRETALRPGEILVGVQVPSVPAEARAGAYKVSKRRELDISAVAGCFVVGTDPAGIVTHARLGYGGMAATPARATRAEAALLGKPWTEATVEAALPAVDRDFTPIDDHRGSAWYRATVARNLLRGFFLETQAVAVPALPDRPVGTVQLPGVP